jgi:hypothetical protein
LKISSQRNIGETMGIKQMETKKSGADIKKPPTGRSNGKPSSSKKPAPSWEITMEINMKRMMQELKREIMEELLERCAKVNWPTYMYPSIIEMLKCVSDCRMLRNY